jgi:Cu/Ag efflux protein CusF
LQKFALFFPSYFLYDKSEMELASIEAVISLVPSNGSTAEHQSFSVTSDNSTAAQANKTIQRVNRNKVSLRGKKKIVIYHSYLRELNISLMQMKSEGKKEGERLANIRQ